jgi:hypothetical protein
VHVTVDTKVLLDNTRILVLVLVHITITSTLLLRVDRLITRGRYFCYMVGCDLAEVDRKGQVLMGFESNKR